MTYNKGYCFNCGEPTENDEQVGNTTLYCCDKPECRRELREERRSEKDEKISRAEDDGYSRYDY
jgi:hypothetical protein